jgi:hypothetical protein
MSVLMWLTMMVAMMLPSLVPMLQRYGTLWAGEAETRLGRLTTLVGASIMWGSAVEAQGQRSRTLDEGREKMPTHKTGTREQWLAERLELLKAEKDLTRRGDELAQRRQELPWVRIAKDYRFDTDGGKASLADLFRGRSQLVVYHFMFGPGYTAGCPTCSATADSFNGVLPHLEARDVTMICISRAPLEKLLA